MADFLLKNGFYLSRKYKNIIKLLVKINDYASFKYLADNHQSPAKAIGELLSELPKKNHKEFIKNINNFFKNWQDEQKLKAIGVNNKENLLNKL